VCVTAEEHRFLVRDALAAGGVSGTLLLEPAARNTAPAMALAARAAPESILLLCPSDHHIPDDEAFRAMVRSAVPSAEEGSIVIFGVTPFFPSTSYGYIQQGRDQSVLRFVEKPPREEAERMLLQGGYLWNSGIVLVRAQVLREALARHAPDVWADVERLTLAPDGLFLRPGDGFAHCRSISLDHAVLERHDRLVVVPFRGQWSDVGTWGMLAELTPPDERGNRVGAGRAWAFDARDTYVHGSDRPVVALGTRDLLIVDTPDALLVAASSHGEQVKEVVAALQRDGIPEARAHRKVHRPWGWYDLLASGPRFQVKRLRVEPGARLSLQLHRRRAEHWVVVQGEATVTRGEETFLLRENESTFIPQGERHRLENASAAPLEIIEIQSGDYLGEDDIVRLEDVYGRGPVG
jgi:mannose-1-phosphate guanylyltransferase/mannose-6-phosphate isomerase